jgi:hypothetical protein
VAIDLKLGKFRAADKGQMALYLRWLARNEIKAGGEEPPAGLICASENARSITREEFEQKRYVFSKRTVSRETGKKFKATRMERSILILNKNLK